ncbi:hypothetical protein [Deinococcus multiflagellatus]|uniref:Uncharacterized protein n=1 Tax=Deinococcus multiflagellatus TaxID=1656887 RepID=A0ABW1ZJC6_9DEIO|nr:hypothetical protein [Deinococcus multiflagellatus]MBZ9713187.1 hypothetical protein [Deinococcus multiflagellatus]
MKEQTDIFPAHLILSNPSNFEVYVDYQYNRQFIHILQLRYYVLSTENYYHSSWSHFIDPLWQPSINEKRPFAELEAILLDVVDSIKSITNDHQIRILVNKDQQNFILIRDIITLPSQHYREMKKTFSDSAGYYGVSQFISLFFRDAERYLIGSISPELFWDKVEEYKEFRKDH